MDYNFYYQSQIKLLLQQIDALEAQNKQLQEQMKGMQKAPDDDEFEAGRELSDDEPKPELHINLMQDEIQRLTMHLSNSANALKAKDEQIRQLMQARQDMTKIEEFEEVITQHKRLKDNLGNQQAVLEENEFLRKEVARLRLECEDYHNLQDLYEKLRKRYNDEVSRLKKELFSSENDKNSLRIK